MFQIDNYAASVEFALREIHLRVSLHKFTEFFLFLQLVTTGKTLLLLSHVEHHLLHC
jgi:hypothetical protein